MVETEQVNATAINRAGQENASPANRSLLEKVTAMAVGARERLTALPAAKRTWLLATAAFLAAACAGMIWFAGRPDWRTLFSDLNGKDVQQVSQELAAAGIPFQATPDGAGVEVPAEMIDKARMEVATRGMPQTGRLGFELFDKPNWVGSEFDERVNYQRALEGELEHTIGTLEVVKSARVHLVLPQPSLFASEEKPAKASVVLKLKRTSIDSEQVDAIRSLVAGSVENLGVDQVTLVDADGRVNFKPRSSDVAASDAEQAMEDKLVAMLEPLAGRDNVRATVNVSYDEGSEERTDEVYDPNEVATLSMQKSEQTSTPRALASGVPGTASNSPAGSPAAAVAGSQAAAAPGTPPLLQKPALPVYPQGSGMGQSLREENGTYGVTKHLVHTQQGPGRVRRVSAAVVVNDRSVPEGAGKLEHFVWKPRNAEEMHRLEQLAQAAVGFDARRGDQVVVQNVSFSTNAPEMKPPAMDKIWSEVRDLIHSQPSLMRTAAVGLCSLVLVLFVLRPMAKQVGETLREPMLLASGNAAEQAGISSPFGGFEERFPPSEDVPAEEASPVRIRTKKQQLQQGIFENVSDHIRRDPAQSTRLIEAWIGSSEESA